MSGCGHIASRSRERELNILPVQLGAMNIDSGVNVKISPGKHSLLHFHESFEHQLCTPVPNNNIQSYFIFYWGGWDGHWHWTEKIDFEFGFVCNCSPG